ncbi:ubiquitin thioesterase OTUB1 [Cryptococcus neoformans Tu401-1]|nr:ubiquitin thioesterase OTUB1 [Cryptococcus neoformans var. grubii Tu401-1]OXM77426.1 ubiquitin thioesterase OTUB1 [Cryptococcus neoformans var. grubii Bt63]
MLGSKMPETHKASSCLQTETPAKKSKSEATATMTAVQPKPASPPAQPEESPARVIDENTDMSTLTDQEIMNLMENMENQENTSDKPLVSTPVPLSVIREEYVKGSQQIVKKLDYLQENGWDQVWRARGDGDCFYRSFILAYLLRILHSPEPDVEANLAYDAIQRALPAMEQCGFQKDIYEEFLDPLLALIRSFAESGETTANEYSIVQALQDPERSNYIVVSLRLITSSYIRTHTDLFSPFLFSPTTFLPLSTEEFCRQEVEPCGKEADNAQIMALAEAMNAGVRVAYLDRSEVGGKTINWVEFGKDTSENARPLTLLYRPGHYDVVTKDVPPKV